jgi:hypothetical protein
MAKHAAHAVNVKRETIPRWQTAFVVYLGLESLADNGLGVSAVTLGSFDDVGFRGFGGERSQAVNRGLNVVANVGRDYLHRPVVVALD